MRYRTLGSSDLEVSVVGLGTNNFGNAARSPDPEHNARVLHAALDAGINLIDTADSYNGGGSERHIGAGLGSRRDEAIIATKFHLTKLEGESVPQRIARSVDESLERLRTDRIDLLQLHYAAPNVPHEELLTALQQEVKAGKVRYIGECNYSGWRHAQSDAVSDRIGAPRMVSAQNCYNLLRRHAELELLPFCTENHIGFLPYYPLAGGWLTGSYRNEQRDTSADGVRRIVKALDGDARAEGTLDRLEAYVKERGRKVYELAFAWLLAHPAVSSVIAGARTIEQVQANARAADWELTREERDAVDALAPWAGDEMEIEQYGAGAAHAVAR